MAGSTALEIGANIATPLALIGFVGALVFLTIQQLLKSGTLPNPPPRLQRLIDRILIFSFAIMLLGVLSAYLLREREVSYRGVVRDSVSNSVISGADVSIEGHSELFPANTDDNGTFAIQGNIRASSLLVTVVVRKDGYRTLRENRTIEISSPVDSIKLVKGRDAAVAATNPASAASAASAPVAAASAPVYETRWSEPIKTGNRSLNRSLSRLKTDTVARTSSRRAHSRWVLPTQGFIPCSMRALGTPAAGATTRMGATDPVCSSVQTGTRFNGLEDGMAIPHKRPTRLYTKSPDGFVSRIALSSSPVEEQPR